jgi:hypothetical protein
MQITPVVNINAAHIAIRPFTSTGRTLYIQFAGSGFRNSAGRISVDLLMDGTVIATAAVYTNETGSHRALVPVAVVIPAAAGQHRFTVAPTPGTGTLIDQNDYFTITVNETTPNYFEKGRVGVNYQSSQGWNLETGTGRREWRQPITFTKAFKSAPEVVLGLTSIDTGNAAHSRLNIEAENVTTTGFDLVCWTWDDGILYGIWAEWLAFGDAQ